MKNNSSTYWIIFIVLVCLVAFSDSLKNCEGNKKSPEQTSSPSSNEIKWTEKDTRVWDEKYKQVTNKSEKKIEKLGYSLIGNVSAECTEAYATTSSSVKIGGDKVYTLKIYFKKIQEYEIIRIDLWDEGSMTKRQIE